jgi:hypothetical protein
VVGGDKKPRVWLHFGPMSCPTTIDLLVVIV